MKNMSIEENLRNLQRFMQLQGEAPNNLPRNRDKVKGKVRLRWNHKTSLNLTQYRIEKIQAESLRESVVEPDPIQLTQRELWQKHYRV